MFFSEITKECNCRVESYECPFCPGTIFHCARDLIEHLEKGPHVKDTSNAVLSCAKCQVTYLRLHEYINHLKRKLIHRYDLHQAACCGRFQDVSKMANSHDADATGISHKIKRNERFLNHLGKTPMHCATFMGYTRCLRVMLSWPNAERFPNVCDDLNQTPVHIAARFGRANCLRLLLEKGGDLNMKDKNGMTPIKLAVKDSECMNVIIEHQLSIAFSRHRMKVARGRKRLSFGEEQMATVDHSVEKKIEIDCADDNSQCKKTFFRDLLLSVLAENCVEERTEETGNKNIIELSDDQHEHLPDSQTVDELCAHGETRREDVGDFHEAKNIVSGTQSTTISQKGTGILHESSSVICWSDTNQNAVVENAVVENAIVERPVVGNYSLGTEILPKSSSVISRRDANLENAIVERRGVGNYSVVPSKMLPYEILARGEEGVKAFKTAVAEGKAQASRLKIIVVGSVKAGKTSLIRSLCGEPFTGTRVKTRGIQMASSVEPIVTSTKLDETWMHADPCSSHYDELLARDICSRLKEKLSKGSVLGLTNSSSDRRELKVVVDEVVGDLPGFQSPEGLSPDGKNVFVVDHSIEVKDSPRPYPATLVARQLSLKSQEKTSIKKVIWDFAGHDLYEPMHHIFMNNTSLYLVVFNLTKMRRSLDKGLAEIHYWLNSIATHTSSSTPVILVGTHKDQVDIDFIEKARAHCERKFDKMFCERLVRSSRNHIMFAVENPKGHEDDGIIELRETIGRDAKNFHFVKQELPLKWLQCEEEIVQHQKASSKKCMHIDEVRNFLEEKCKTSFNELEFKSMLTFFHDGGLILYPGVMYEEQEESIAKDFVIMSPQYLVDRMCDIHEVPEDNELKRRFSNEFHKLKKEARVDRGLLEQLWEHKSENMEVLIELLICFKLIYPFHKNPISDSQLQESSETSSSGIHSSNEFVIPCMLKKKTKESFQNSWSKACADWTNAEEKEHRFVFDFGRFLPPPLFDFLLLHVYQESHRTKGISPILRRRAGIFSFSNRFLFCLRLVLKDCQIWVHARCNKGEKFRHLARTLNEKVSDICQQYFKFLRFSCGPPCPHEACPGAEFNEEEIQRPYDASSSEGEKDSDSDDDDDDKSSNCDACAQDVRTPKNHAVCQPNLRTHVIAMDPATFDPPYWCKAKELTSLLIDWHPLCGIQDEDVVDSRRIWKDRVNECCISSIARHLGDDSKKLARELKISEAEIENIVHDNRGQEEHGFKFLHRWKSKLGSDATKSSLIDALIAISRKDLVDIFQNHQCT